MSESAATETETPVDFRTDPSRYRHWKLGIDGPIATLTMDVEETGGLRPGLSPEAELLRPWRRHRAARRTATDPVRAPATCARSC